METRNQMKNYNEKGINYKFVNYITNWKKGENIKNEVNYNRKEPETETDRQRKERSRD